jgi:hypothetical protein
MRALVRTCWHAATLAAITLAVAGAQAAPPAGQATADTVRADAVRVFVDCQATGCDQQFFVDQMKWVNFVRDRQFADVILFVTSLRTGAGGTEHTVSAIGAQRYRGKVDTALVHNAPNDAQDVIRRRLLRTFSLLLGPYAARTDAAQRITVSYAAPAGAAASPQSTRDPWNFWVFRLSASGYGSGEKRQSFGSTYFNTSASRVTAAWKTTFSTNLSYDQSKFDLGEGATFNKIQRDYGGNALMVKSLNDHWSTGFTARAQYSDFSNYDLNFRVLPAIEWDYYPYREFTSRQLTAFYNLGMAFVRYQDTTIYDKVREAYPMHSLNVAWNVRQTWGSVNVSVFGSQYLHDRAYYSYGIGGFTDLRLTKGLSLNLGGNYSRVNDQLYLRRGTLTDAEIIARQEALATNFRYFLNFGVSYTFGSIFNTVVNPRFNSQGSGGGGIMISF